MSHLFGIGLQVEVNKINMSFRMQLAKRGLAAFKHLNKVFHEMDSNGNGFLDYKEFERGLAALGLFPSKVQLQTLFKVYDSNQDGKISYEEFVSVLR
jgi:Ca2+-binding EF-hand superfamily protein